MYCNKVFVYPNVHVSDRFFHAKTEFISLMVQQDCVESIWKHDELFTAHNLTPFVHVVGEKELWFLLLLYMSLAVIFRTRILGRPKF